MGYELGVESTKSFSTSESTQLTTFENKILSAYCLVFGNDGSRIGDIVTLTVTDNVIQPHTLYHNFSKGPLTVCFLANIPASYVQSIDHIDDFVDIPLGNISYSSYQTDNKDVVIVPEIGGNKCLPMFGCITQSYENGVLAGVTKDDNGNHVATVPLLRLFSRVNVNLQVKTSTSVILNRSNFDLTQLTVRNLPTKVRLKEMVAGNESAWVKVQSDFYDPITLNPDIKIENGSLISSPSFDFVCYVPEYCLLPDQAKVAEVNAMSGITEAQKQKYKPNLYDPAKYPVHLNLVGKSSQPNFVDVPLEYNIFLGEDAFDSFSFYRNWQYDNNISINGMGDAILGTDDRVEAAYHNLADPNNTGNPNPANCYIISKPGRYLLPTYIGNQVSGGTQTGTAAEQLSLNGSADNKITNITLVNKDGKQYIQFDVNMYASDGTFSPVDVAGGNKLLVLKNGSNVVWSWHLWFCEDNDRPEAILDKYPGNNGLYNGSQLMNRALGAITVDDGIDLSAIIDGLSGLVWTDGLYYQWGRKDPMLASGNGVPQTGGNYANSKQNPRVFYKDWTASGAGWNVNLTNGKSVDDPCPPGYKVPSSAVWRSSNPDEDQVTTVSSRYTYNLSRDSGDEYPTQYIFYPFPRYVDNSTGEQVALPSRVTVKENATSSEKTFAGQGIRVKYSLYYHTYYGALWGDSLNSLYYKAYIKEFVPHSAELHIVIGSWINRWTTLPLEQLWGYLSFEELDNWITSSVGGIPPYEYSPTYSGYTADKALHVRCVKE